MFRKTLFSALSFFLIYWIACPLCADSNNPVFPIPGSSHSFLGRIFMCESVNENQPVNETIVFPVANGNAVCFTYLNRVAKKTFLYHNWYKSDKLMNQFPLQIEPHQESIFSKIPLRESDKGTWQVEILDENNNLLKVLRFSVTD